MQNGSPPGLVGLTQRGPVYILMRFTLPTAPELNAVIVSVLHAEAAHNP